MVNRRKILVALGAGMFAAPLAAVAQPTGKVYRIGFIQTAPRKEIGHLIKALDDGLRELGYVEGRNVVFERRFADGKQERLAALAVELVKLKVDIIVTGSNPVIAAVRQATATIPVVMAVSRDPVGSGFIASLARPGGNITGLANDPAPEIMGKNLELLKEVVPRASRVALLWNPVPAGAAIYKNAVETAARNLGVTLQSVEIRAENEFESAFAAMIRERANGVVVTSDPIFLGSRSQLVRLAGRHRLPTVYVQREFVEAGGLMSYGGNLAYQFRRAAVYVDKILKGAKPADLPVEQPTQFDLVVNMRTAKDLGIKIPNSVLALATKVIE
jgi:putative ABC transport system substrate-binding protein